ncbi:hypothetical protein J6590_010561 [Homalodisca vitripennis]|nr:hypothetical protein J6590_010561 [Homalodisca vitripennis]
MAPGEQRGTVVYSVLHKSNKETLLLLGMTAAHERDYVRHSARFGLPSIIVRLPGRGSSSEITSRTWPAFTLELSVTEIPRDRFALTRWFLKPYESQFGFRQEWNHKANTAEPTESLAGRYVGRDGEGNFRAITSTSPHIPDTAIIITHSFRLRPVASASHSSPYQLSWRIPPSSRGITDGRREGFVISHGNGKDFDETRSLRRQ